MFRFCIQAHHSLFVAGLLLASACTLAAPPKYRYLYYDWGETPKRDDYEFKALQVALEKTRATHGDFSVERIVRSFSRRRAMREVNNDKLLNVRPGPWIKGDNKNRPKAEINLPVEIPIMHSLLGYRRLIVRKADLPLFANLSNSDQIRKLVAGQGQGWVDMFVYDHNRYAASDSAEVIESLVPMLVKNRFDYVPMSVVEINSLIDRSGIYSKAVAEVPNLTLYYPFPVIFYVSSKRPELAKRLERGLEIATRDGTLEALLRDYFADEIARLEHPDNRFFVLKNPFLPKRAWVPPPIFDKSEHSSQH